MNNKSLLMLAIFGCFAVSELAIASGRDTTVKTILNCVGYVVGGCTTGDITMGAAGEPQTIDTAGVEMKNLGVLSRPLTFQLTVPANGMKILTFTPTEGDFKNRQIDVLFYTLDLTQPFPANAPKDVLDVANKVLADPAQKASAKTIIAAFRRGPGETQWTSFYGEAVSDTPADLKDSKGLKTVVGQWGRATVFLPSFQALQKDGTTQKVSAAPLIIELAGPNPYLQGQ